MESQQRNPGPNPRDLEGAQSLLMLSAQTAPSASSVRHRNLQAVRRLDFENKRIQEGQFEIAPSLEFPNNQRRVTPRQNSQNEDNSEPSKGRPEMLSGSSDPPVASVISPNTQIEQRISFGNGRN